MKYYCLFRSQGLSLATKVLIEVQTMGKIFLPKCYSLTKKFHPCWSPIIPKIPDDLFCSFVVSLVLFSSDLVKQLGYRGQGQENFHGFSFDPTLGPNFSNMLGRGWTIPLGRWSIPLGENYPLNYHSACDTRILKVVKSFLLDGPPSLPPSFSFLVHPLLFPSLSFISASSLTIPSLSSPSPCPCPPPSGSAGQK